MLLYDVRPPQKIWEKNSENFSQKMNFCISDIRKILNENIETNEEERRNSFLSSSTDQLDIERNEETEERNETEAETERNETERKQKGKHSIMNLNSEGGNNKNIK